MKDDRCAFLLITKQCLICCYLFNFAFFFQFSRIAFLCIFTGDNEAIDELLISAGIENNFLITTNISVDSNAYKLILYII